MTCLLKRVNGRLLVDILIFDIQSILFEVSLQRYFLENVVSKLGLMI